MDWTTPFPLEEMKEQCKVNPRKKLDILKDEIQFFRVLPSHTKDKRWLCQDGSVYQFWIWTKYLRINWSMLLNLEVQDLYQPISKVLTALLCFILDKAKLLLLKLIHLFAREVLIHSLKSKKERLPSLQLLKLVEKKCA